MPTKTRHKKSARATRKRAQRRAARPGPARRRGEKHAHPQFIADSIHALTLKSKKGVDVYFNLRGYQAQEIRNADNFYKDICGAFRNLYKQIKGEDFGDPMKRMNMTRTDALWFIINCLDSSLLPSGYKFNFDFDEHCTKECDYHITIYHECDWSEHWNVFDIGPAVKKLQKENPGLLKLFFSFLKKFAKVCGIDFWNDGFMGAELERMEERVWDWESYYEEKEMADGVREEYNIYTTGEIADIRKQISKAKDFSPAQILSAARRYKKQNPITKIIQLGAEVMRPGYNIMHYRYISVSENERPDFYLDLGDQLNIIWDFNDELTQMQQEALDSHANEGGFQYPLFAVKVTSKTKDIDFLKYKDAVRWPMQLHKFFSDTNDLLNKYHKR